MQDPIVNNPSPLNNPQKINPTQNPKESGESTVQNGEEIVNQEEQTQVVNEESQEEYIDNVNVESTPSN